MLIPWSPRDGIAGETRKSVRDAIWDGGSSAVRRRARIGGSKSSEVGIGRYAIAGSRPFRVGPRRPSLGFSVGHRFGCDAGDQCSSTATSSASASPDLRSEPRPQPAFRCCQDHALLAALRVCRRLGKLVGIPFGRRRER
jgi:hypothetical protein